MEPIAECQIDLFADKLPSLDEIQQLRNFVNSSESSYLAFVEQIEQNSAKTSQKAKLSVGIGLFILGRNEQAAQKLKQAGPPCREKFIYLAFALRRLGQFEQAIENLDKSLDHQADTLYITLEKAATYRHALNYDAAADQLKACANFENTSAEYHYQLGRLQEIQGLYKQATDNYEIAIELSPEHQKALFYLAYRCDLSGDEEAAIDYYKQIVSISPAYVSALINLAVLYEDAEKFEKATRCIDKVLEFHPNHQRAILFKKDIENSKTMVYDEEKEKKKDRKAQMLETPISDFELSVRSRNCLRKMNIRTIGDLLNITEAELLSYKNFGETSLKEIKLILDSRSLRLGMMTEQEHLVSIQAADYADDSNIESQGLLRKSVDDLPLSVRSRKALQKLNLTVLGDLTHRTEAELLGCKNFGVTSLNEVKECLANIGLSLRSLD